MHAYSTDTWITYVILFVLAAMSILAAYGFHVKFEEEWKLIAPWWLAPTSTFGFYWLFYNLFNRLVWRIPWFSKTMKVPDLNGSWLGHVFSNYVGATGDPKVEIVEIGGVQYSKYDVEIKIRQTWSKILITMDGVYSRSKSQMAAVDASDPDAIEIRYQYDSIPQACAVDTMNRCDGTAMVLYKNLKGVKTLDGNYYTGRGRKTHGEVHLRLVKDKR